MLVLPGNQRQFCTNQWHDGQPGKNGRPMSRALWPFHDFTAAVAAYTAHTAGEAAKRLPDLDLEAFSA